MHRTMRTKTFRIAAVVVALFVLAGCQPERPAAGRGTPVKRVLLIGDSVTHGLFGTSPNVHPYVQEHMRQRGISLWIGGFAAENPIWVFPGHAWWENVMRERIASFNPDMVIIQTMLFPEASDPAKRAQYLSTTRTLLDIAKSRGAHTYLVSHAIPPHAKERVEYAVAKQLQEQASAGRGVEWIPLDWWMANCRQPFINDGWHLSAGGQRCHADAITAAVDQLREVNG